MLIVRKYMLVLLVVITASCHTDAGRQPVTEYVNENGRNDAWGYVGYGGGGAMFYPTVSPFNPAFVLIACDMTGSYVSYDGGKKWRMFNLGNPVSFFLFDPVDSNVVYANAGALYRSDDRARTWQIVYPAEDDIAGVISKGDHAATVVVPKDSILRRVTALGIDPSDSERLVAGVTVNGQHALLVSADRGKNWQKEMDAELPFIHIWITPRQEQKHRIYALTAKGIHVKEDGGWLYNAIPGEVGSMTTFTAGFDSMQQKTILYGISGTSYFNNAADSSGIFFTSDGGRTWENRQAGLTTLCNGCTPEWRTIATSARYPHVVYVSYNNLQKGDTVSIGVAKSEDYGVNWSLVWEDRFFKGGYEPASNFSAEWINERFGPYWGENPFSMGVSPSNPDICYATDFGRAIATNNGGASWEQVYTRKTTDGWASRGLEVTTSYDIVMNPFDSSNFFICNTDVGLMESRDGGYSWNSATRDNGIPGAWVNSTYWMVFDPAVRNRAWAVMSGTHDLPRPKMWRRAGISRYKGGILRTDDGGTTWQPVSGALGEGAFTHILLDPASDKSNRTLYACGFGKGVYKSTDGGITWVEKNKGLPGKEPFAWRMHRRAADGALLLVISRRTESDTGEGHGAVYISKDGAGSWMPLNLPEGTNGPTDIVTDAAEPKRLLLAAWGRVNPGVFTPDTGGGIFISDNEGATWKQVLQEDQHIHDITYDSRTHTYYACGFNSNAWKSTDSGNSWQRIRGYNFKWGKRVVPDPRDSSKIFVITFGGGVWHGPAAGDSTATEDVVSRF